MKSDRNFEIDYSAKKLYRDESEIEKYEERRFGSLIGKYRYRREQRAISSIIDLVPNNIIIADCPCGNGRWWNMLAKRAKQIVALDLSPTMLKAARKRMNDFDLPIDIYNCDAEHIPLQNNTVDYTFCHALTKHLPLPVQFNVLMEISRISSQGVICSFGILNHFTYEFWRHRKLEESYPLWPEALSWMASAANLKIIAKKKCTTPLGVEYTVLFEKVTK
jgi:ubiquinone/menaquinone biosynthesis C-methylase UbiE